MTDMVHVLTLTDILSVFDFRTLTVGYILFMSFVVPYCFYMVFQMDKFDILNDKYSPSKSKRLMFKNNVWFIITYSKNKKNIIKKTFILDIIVYGMALFTTIMFISYLVLRNDILTILLACCETIGEIISMVIFVCYRQIMYEVNRIV